MGEKIYIYGTFEKVMEETYPYPADKNKPPINGIEEQTADTNSRFK